MHTKRPTLHLRWIEALYDPVGIVIDAQDPFESGPFADGDRRRIRKTEPLVIIRLENL